MPFHFCPQCGTKLQPDFKFCPSCGERLPCPEDEPVSAGVTTSLRLSSPQEEDERAAARTSRDSAPVPRLTQGKSDHFHDAFHFLAFPESCAFTDPRKTLTLSRRTNFYHIESSYGSFSAAKDPKLSPPGGVGLQGPRSPRCPPRWFGQRRPE